MGFVHTSPLRASIYTSEGEAQAIAEYSQEWQRRHLDALGIADLPGMRYAGEYAAFYFERSSGVLVPWCRTHFFRLSTDMRDNSLSEQQKLTAKALAFRGWVEESRIHAGWRSAAINGAQGSPAETTEWHVLGVLHDALMVLCVILVIRLAPAARVQRKLVSRTEVM